MSFFSRHQDQLEDLGEKLDQVLANQKLIKGALKIMSTELDALTAAVTENTTIEQSAITLIQGLASQIAANATDPAAITALAGQLSASAASLAQAVAANTPTPIPTPTPVPTPPAGPTV